MTIQFNSSVGVDNTYCIDKGIITLNIYETQPISIFNILQIETFSVFFLLGKIRVNWKLIQDENSPRFSNNCRWCYHTKFEPGKFNKPTSNYIILFVLHGGIVEYVLYNNFLY